MGKVNCKLRQIYSYSPKERCSTKQSEALERGHTSPDIGSGLVLREAEGQEYPSPPQSRSPVRGIRAPRCGHSGELGREEEWLKGWSARKARRLRGARHSDGSGTETGGSGRSCGNTKVSEGPGACWDRKHDGLQWIHVNQQNTPTEEKLEVVESPAALIAWEVLDSELKERGSARMLNNDRCQQKVAQAWWPRWQCWG